MKRLLLTGCAVLILSATAHAQSPDFRTLFGPAIQANRVAQQRFEDKEYTLGNCRIGAAPQSFCRQKYPAEMQQRDEDNRIYNSLDHDCIAFAPSNVLVQYNQQGINVLREYCSDPEHVKQAHVRAGNWRRQVSEPPLSRAHTDCMFYAFAQNMPNPSAVCAGVP
jgi:hypothetical protein